MSDISLETSDRHTLGAYAASSSGPEQIGGLIVLHEIFGITPYIQSVCDYWACQGFDVLAPALFDRQERGLQIDYGDPALGKRHASNASLDNVRRDIEACEMYLRIANSKVALIGFCWGGGLAYWAACRLGVDAAASIYGTRLPQYASRSPQCPFQFSFARRDPHCASEIRGLMAQAAPGADQEIYDADHGFDRQDQTVGQLQTQMEFRQNLRAFLVKHLR